MADTITPLESAPDTGEMTLQYDGLDKLTDAEREAVVRISEHNYPKIQRDIKNLVKIVVHVKMHGDKNPDHNIKKKRLYSVHLHVHAPTKTIRVSNADAWELEESLHRAFDEVRREIDHAFRSRR